MSYQPPFIALDYETEEDGRGSTEAYRPNFRVSSAAFSWRDSSGAIKSEFIQGENSVYYYLERLAKAKIPLIAHNIQFETLVTVCRFRDLAHLLNWHACTMRLVQVYDGGGDDLAFEAPSIDDQLDALEGDKPKKLKSLSGLGLSKSVARILRKPDHKKEAHDWLKANVDECKSGRHYGANLGKLPPDILRHYNVGDTEATLLLYEFTTKFFKSIKYDWTLDHGLYLNAVRMVVGAKIRGVPVDRDQLTVNRGVVAAEIDEIERGFRARFAAPIAAIERERLLKAVTKLKTLKGRRRLLRRVKSDSAHDRKVRVFNIGSNAQLQSLFVDTLEMPVTFRSDKGRPSFRSAVLGQFGEGGEMLKTRRKRMLVLTQIDSLLELSAFDGRWHLDLKLAATKTGRAAGGQHG
jgi:hypothetical protein